MRWAGQAEELLSGVIETGVTAALIVAAAWRAGVDPAATDGLTGAALWMHAEPRHLLSGGLAPMPSDREMITQAADVATEAGNHLAGVRALSGQVTRALDAGIRELGRLQALLRAAQAGEAEAQFSAVEAAIKATQARVADCEHALELLITLGTRLGHALDCLERVPDDLLTTYELAYEHRRLGRTLPFDGGFLTGVPACLR